MPQAPLLRRIGIDLPIIQAPMAGVSTPEMAAAAAKTRPRSGAGARIALRLRVLHTRTSAPRNRL
jgi:NAD(P)H-dependent flavin oxidoreductase YrpB (nitropropane dioxygenase family)